MVVCQDKGEINFRSNWTDGQKRDEFRVTWQAPASEQTIVTLPILKLIDTNLCDSSTESSSFSYQRD